MQKHLLIVLIVCGSRAYSQDAAPIVDVHLHALRADSQGPPPLTFCLPTRNFPAHDPSRPYQETFMRWLKPAESELRSCEHIVSSLMTDEEVMQSTLEILDRHNIIGITSGPLTSVYRSERPERIIPALMFSVGSNPPSIDELRMSIENGDVTALAEVTNQYQGILPDDPRFAPYLELAEELDIPVGIHVGPGPPGVAYLGASDYRARLHSPLILEDVLLRHPKLRLYVMHAGWPMTDDMIALMWAHPQVYAGLGVISFVLPPEEFHYYLRRLVGAGLSNRIMYGSDQMVWPEGIEIGIAEIQAAPYLSEEQKRDILYNNAAMFFRFSNEMIQTHHGEAR